MEADFLFNQTNIFLKNLKNAEEKVIAFICNGNKINQSFFEKFEKFSKKSILN